MNSPFVEQLLEKAHKNYNIVYQVYLANHLPHALYTLHALDASNSRIQEYYENYVKQLEPLGASKFNILTSNWTQFIGDTNLYPEFLAFFDKEIKERGTKLCLEKYFNPVVCCYSFGAALHPLIHIGFGVEFNNPLVLAEGLAYACTYPLKIAHKIETKEQKTSKDLSVLEIVLEMENTILPNLDIRANKFREKVEYIIDICKIQLNDLISRWDLTSDELLNTKLNELTEASIAAVFGSYEKEIDFFLVHGITGNHAVRILFPFLSIHQKRDILKTNMLVLLAVYIVQGRPHINLENILGYKVKEMPDENIKWEGIIEVAVNREEEHISKIIRCLNYYLKSVVNQNSSYKTLGDNALKRCAFKMIDIVKDINDYKF